MRVDPADGLPLVGSDRSCLLGVRPTGKHADIDLDPPGDLNGNVVLNRKGLSVTSDWRKLPPFLIPEELDDGFNGASGKGMKVYVHGGGAFAEGPVAAGLEMFLKSHSQDSGVVGPTTSVPLLRYQAGLQATRAQWVDDPS